MQFGHLWAVGKLLKYPESEGQRLFDLGALLAIPQLLQLLYVLVQLQVVQDYRHEKREHDLQTIIILGTITSKNSF